MNFLTEFFAVFSAVFDLVYEWFPWLIPATLFLLAISMLRSLFRILFACSPCDPQDYDAHCPSEGCDHGDPEPVHIPTNRSQYDPEHWYTGKD